jgi:hypothetical protein
MTSQNRMAPAAVAQRRGHAAGFVAEAQHAEDEQHDGHDRHDGGAHARNALGLLDVGNGHFRISCAS